MHEYLRQIGFDEAQGQTIVWAYHEARGGGAVDGASLLTSLQVQLGSLDEIEQWVDEGIVAGEAYENFTD
jgi:hypothetical protein